MQLPGPLREAIEQELAGCDGAPLQEAAARLGLIYREGGATAAALANELDHAAYLAVRMPATFAAIASALRWTREALLQEALPQEVLHEQPGREQPGREQPLSNEDPRIRSVLDLGSGPGTALWAAAQLFPMLASATCIERDPRLIDIGRRLAARSHDSAVQEATWLCGDLTAQLAEGSWDLVVCAYALNEIDERQRAGLIRQAWERCAKLLVIVEPGTKAGFANVLAVRSQMLYPGKPTAGSPGAPVVSESESDASPFLAAPCPNSLACPMATGGDWCHFAARVERTATHRRLKQATLGHEDEKFSYVAFMRGSIMRGAPADMDRPEAARMVRHPRIFGGHAQLTLCREGEIASTTVTRSEKEDWRRLKRLGWGDRW